MDKSSSTGSQFVIKSMTRWAFTVILLSCVGLSSSASQWRSSAAHRRSPRALMRNSARESGRIINGEAVASPSGDAPYFGLLTERVDTNMWLGCGASLISPTYAMSAAHCFGGGYVPCDGPKQVALWFGDVKLGTTDNNIEPEPTGSSFRIEADLVCHPQWDGKCSHGHDVVLLKLNSSKLADGLPTWLVPVTIALDQADHLQPKTGDTVTAMGFGLMEGDHADIVGDLSPVLRKATVQLMAANSTGCAQVYAGGYGCSDQASEAPGENPGDQLCAASDFSPGKDSCSGDSGGPLLDNDGRQIGIVSYGGGPGERSSGPGRSCGDPDWPGFYSRVSAFRNFIVQNVPDVNWPHQAIAERVANESAS